LLRQSEIEYMKKTARQITEITTCEIRYRSNTTNSDYGYGEQEYSWSHTLNEEWDIYKCSIEKVDKYNIGDYPFGSLEEGDLVLLLPNDINIDLKGREYEIRLGDDVYVSLSPPKKMGLIGDTFLYYALAGRLK